MAGVVFTILAFVLVNVESSKGAGMDLMGDVIMSFALLSFGFAVIIKVAKAAGKGSRRLSTGGIALVIVSLPLAAVLTLVGFAGLIISSGDLAESASVGAAALAERPNPDAIPDALGNGAEEIPPPAIDPRSDEPEPEPEFVQPVLTLGTNSGWSLDVRMKNVDENYYIVAGESNFRLVDGEGNPHKNDYYYAAQSGRPFPHRTELQQGDHDDGWLVFSSASEAPYPFTLVYQDGSIHAEILVAE